MNAQEIVYAWIRDHAPLTVKMNVMPHQSDRLIEAIYDAMQAARNDAIEEAAKRAEGTEQTREWVRGSLYDTLRRETAASIRALKS
jgi:ribosomal silencing factor RsfS